MGELNGHAPVVRRKRVALSYVQVVKLNAWISRRRQELPALDIDQVQALAEEELKFKMNPSVLHNISKDYHIKFRARPRQVREPVQHLLPGFESGDAAVLVSAILYLFNPHPTESGTDYHRRALQQLTVKLHVDGI